MHIERSSASAQGVDPAGVIAFIDALDRDPQIEPHGLIIQRHGRRIAEGYWGPHTAGRSRLLYSLSKTFTGTALALQLGEGRLGLDDLVSTHLPEAFVGAHEGLRDLRIRHIASMATGHDRETLHEARQLDADDVVRGFLRVAPAAAPGTLFAYNQPPVIALATILQRLAGERLVDYLRPRLFAPLGMDAVGSMQLAPGIDYGFTGVYASLDAVARLGQLYLDDGVCVGQRLLPQGWVAQASHAQVANPANTEPDWRQGYGFQLWRSQHGYRGDGAFGQYMVVLPEQDTVVALFSCTATMQRVLDHLWTHLLPALSDNTTKAQADDAALTERLASLQLPTAQTRRGGAAPRAADGVYLPVRHDDNDHRTITSIRLEGTEITLNEGDRQLRAVLGERWTQTGDGTCAVSATQCADGSVGIDVVMLATPHRLELELQPSSQTFTARWPLLPIFGAGIEKFLAAMRAPV